MVNKFWVIEPISEQLIALLTIMSHLLPVIDVPNVNPAGLMFLTALLLFFLFDQF